MKTKIQRKKCKKNKQTNTSVTMGKTSEGPPEVSFVDENSCTVRKKVAYVLGFLAVASCIVVGLVVYYAGGNMGCGVFNREKQKYIDFRQKNNHTQKTLLWLNLFTLSG